MRIASVGLLILGVVAGLMLSRASLHVGDWGTIDFIEYWSANQVAEAGGNPWDTAHLLAVEQAQGWSDAVPLMMWNPPWLLVMMRPVLQRPFLEAAATWMGVNVVMATMACILIASGYRRAQFAAIDLVPATVASVISVPALVTFRYGQVSILLLLSIALLYWALRSGHDFTAGVALALLSVKPHLFLLVALLVAVQVLRAKRWRIVVGAAVAMGALLIATAHQSPSLPLDWWLAASSPPDGASPAYLWSTPNLPNVVRALLTRWTGVRPMWPLTVIPLGAFALCAPWLWRRSRVQPAHDLFPVVLCLSVITAPFGWTCDHVVLAVPQIIILIRAFGEIESAWHRWAITTAILLCHVGVVAQAALTGADYSAFWWFPLAMLLVWRWSARALLSRPKVLQFHA